MRIDNNIRDEKLHMILKKGAEKISSGKTSSGKTDKCKGLTCKVILQYLLIKVQ